MSCFDDLDGVGKDWSGILYIDLHWDLLVFLIVRRGLWFSGKRITEVKCSVITVQQGTLVTVCVSLGHLAEAVLVGLPHHEVTFPGAYGVSS